MVRVISWYFGEVEAQSELGIAIAAWPEIRSKALKRFFFDLYSDTVTKDEEGIVLENVETARAHAIKCAQMMAADDASKGRSDLSRLLKVRDESGRDLCAVRFEEAVIVES